MSFSRLASGSGQGVVVSGAVRNGIREVILGAFEARDPRAKVPKGGLHPPCLCLLLCLSVHGVGA